MGAIQLAHKSTSVHKEEDKILRGAAFFVLSYFVIRLHGSFINDKL